MPSWQAGRERARPAWDHSPCPHFRALGTCPVHLLSRGRLALSLSLHSAAALPAPRRPSSVTAAVGTQGRGQHRPGAVKPSATLTATPQLPAEQSPLLSSTHFQQETEILEEALQPRPWRKPQSRV